MEGEERFEHPYVQDFISANQLFFFLNARQLLRLKEIFEIVK